MKTLSAEGKERVARALDELEGAGFAFKRSVGRSPHRWMNQYGVNKRALDSLEGAGFGLKKKALDYLEGSDFGMGKRALDAMEGSGFGFQKRALDYLEGIMMLRLLL